VWLWAGWATSGQQAVCPLGTTIFHAHLHSKFKSANMTLFKIEQDIKKAELTLISNPLKKI
jgi:hypothetical protein